MLALELADGCVQCVTEEAIQGAGIIAAGSKDRLHHRDIRAGHGLVAHAGRPSRPHKLRIIRIRQACRMLIHSAARPLRRRPASAGLFFGFFTQLCLEFLCVAEAGVHVAVVGLLLKAADLVRGGPDVIRSLEDLPESCILSLGGQLMQGESNLHGHVVQGLSGLLPEVVEFQLSPLPGRPAPLSA